MLCTTRKRGECSVQWAFDDLGLWEEGDGTTSRWGNRKLMGTRWNLMRGKAGLRAGECATTSMGGSLRASRSSSTLVAACFSQLLPSPLPLEASTVVNDASPRSIFAAACSPLTLSNLSDHSGPYPMGTRVTGMCPWSRVIHCLNHRPVTQVHALPVVGVAIVSLAWRWARLCWLCGCAALHLDSIANVQTQT